LPRIKCYARRFIRGKLFPFVTLVLVAKRPAITRPMVALIDTGSPFTVLSPKDVMSSRLPITRMQSGETVGLAGFRFFNHPIKNVTLNFRTEEGKRLEVSLPSIGALIPTKIDKKTLGEVKDIPSILGNDFLEDQKFALYFNPSTQTAYLEC